MPWMISIDEMEAICHEIEKSLHACGHSHAISIVRSKFVEPRRVYFLDDVSQQTKCDLRLLDWSSMGDLSYSLRLKGN